MKKMAMVFLVVLAMFCFGFSTAAAQDGGEYQMAQASGQYAVSVKCVHYGPKYQTVVDITDLFGLTTSVFLGDNIYIFEVIALDDGKFLFIGGDWSEGRGVFFRIDPEYPYYYDELKLRAGEFIRNNYKLVPGGVYFATSFYPEGDKPSSVLVRFWDFWSSTASKIVGFSQAKRYFDVYFGYVEGVNANPGLLVVKGGRDASVYRINGGTLALAKTFKVNPRAGNLGFCINKDNTVDVWGDIWFYQTIN